MKKILLILFLMVILLALAACNGEDAAQNPAETLPTARDTGPISLGVPFIWDGLEVTFHENFTFVSFERGVQVERITEDGTSNFNTYQAIRLPLTITNMQDEANGLDDFIILGPYSDQEGRIGVINPGTVHLLDTRFINNNIDETYERGRRVNAGETSETYFFIPYVKDGNYRIVFWIGGVQRILTIPVVNE